MEKNKDKTITSEYIKRLIQQGETTTVQFKIRSEDAYKTGVEMVAFSNTQGGMLIIGIDDKNGAILDLSFEEIQRTNNLLACAASENVKPAIVITTETVNVDRKNIIVATVPKGRDKPYKDNKGIIWVKNGSDKRKVFSNSELRVMMQSCGNLSADSDSVENSSYKDISDITLKNFLYERYAEECKKAGITNDAVLEKDIDEIVKAIELTNAFIHRDYYVNSPIRLFIFDNRIEIHSPGILPDGVTEESIKSGISVPRNKLLFENAKDILPYTGIGSGIMRAMQNYDKIQFRNDFVREEFITTIVRDEISENEGVNIENEAINRHFEGVNIENEGVNIENEGVKLNIEGVEGKVKRELELIYNYIENNPLVKVAAIEQFCKKSNATVERYIRILKNNDLIEFVGADKTGGYKIKETG